MAKIHSPPDLTIDLLVPLAAKNSRGACVFELHYLHSHHLTLVAMRVEMRAPSGRNTRESRDVTA